MTILMTGATGQVGRRVVARLDRAGAPVRGAEWTHVRPGEFMLNMLWLWGPSIRAEGIVRDPAPDATARSSSPAGSRPRSSAPRGREVRFERVAPERAREIYRAQGGFAAANADFPLGFEDYSGAPADPAAHERTDLSANGPLPTARQVTGHPARTFAQWARDHAADFRA
ncbi:hypothetical protein [Actinomadura violacea]|uniref:Uncharacterized protein n=1 Tax=Actinomadura violacea TaxID=2819934 RepID=A0ABS3RNP7_9ACTN|nr:hypothetical protein [Actinomadura violacea]MBO2458384.1 hypothetical protein [Actinomadura violacea]